MQLYQRNDPLLELGEYFIIVLHLIEQLIRKRKIFIYSSAISCLLKLYEIKYDTAYRKRNEGEAKQSIPFIKKRKDERKDDFVAV